MAKGQGTSGNAGLYTGIFVLAGASLMLEILMTRVISVVAWYHLAFFVIALAMLGMTVGAVVVFVAERWFGRDVVVARMATATTAAAVVTPIALMFVMANPLLPVTDFMSFAGLVGVGFGLAAPFACIGVALTLGLTRAGLPPGRAYGADLAGAALGCVAIIFALDYLDAGSAVLLVSALISLAGLCFSMFASSANHRQAGNPWSPAILPILLMGLTVVHAGQPEPWLRPAWVKGIREVPELYDVTTWNTHSRVTVSKTVPAPPMLWGAGRLMPKALKQPIPQRAILIDGAAGTNMAHIGAGPQSHAYLEWDVTSFAHRMRPTGPAAVIGVGGGRDVLEAVRVGHPLVVGVELNAAIIDLHTQRFAGFSGLAGLPGVELVSDEARSYLARETRRFDVITMSLIDTWASTGAGAYSLSENGLYTVEAWELFLSRLGPTGIFTVSRWFKADSPGETARMLAVAMQALFNRGVATPREHLIVLQHHNVATLLVSPTPFSAADLDTMQREAVRLGFNMMLTPRRLPRQALLRELAELQTGDALWRWGHARPLDLTPPTDDRPFFFNMLRPSHWLQDPKAVASMDLAFLGNLRATQTLVYAILASLVMALVAVFLPLWRRRQALRSYRAGVLVAACCYFGLIGVGFMFVEIGLLSRLNVFLGHPTLSLAVVLGGLIAATGLGSLLSHHIPLHRRVWARLYPLIPGALVMVVHAVQDPVMAASAGASTPIRVAVCLALIAPPALGMGLGFPLGLELLARCRAEGVTGGRSRPDLGPWMWGINGVFGVCASGLAVACSMIWGISTTLSLGALCYLALPFVTWALTRR